ncbi:unnamed protein product [Schistosoma mattheei]|uniref:Uncharacterized protein n=1 Tax=Schistosoma mattheei TaxID=31246 RepID=A0A183Q5K5_9TREM|nr:unnamed protein product [Schistosoma mattheei]
MLLYDWVALTPELMIGSEVVERVDRFTYLGSLVSPCGLVCDEISARIQRARLAFANLRHLWRRRDIRLPTKGRTISSGGCIFSTDENEEEEEEEEEEDRSFSIVGLSNPSIVEGCE